MNNCIYAYIDKETKEIVYIGKESNWRHINRHYNHLWSEKDIYDKYEYIELVKYELAEIGPIIEKALIQWAQPRLNKQHNKRRKHDKQRNV